MGGFLILGGGKSGQAVREYFQRTKKEHFFIKDTREDASAEILIKALNAEIEMAVLSPGIPDTDKILSYLKEKGIPVMSELAFATSLFGCPIHAITGTNGKTTTVSILSKLFIDSGLNTIKAGNIGTPLVSFVEESFKRNTVAVVEVSSFQLMYAEGFSPNTACILNITPDHLDRHGSMDAYIEAKMRIFANLKSDGICVLNLDDPQTAKMKPSSIRTYYVSLRKETEGAFYRGGSIFLGGMHLIEASRLKIKGLHNIQNVMFASLCAFLNGVSKQSIADSLEDFNGLKHRLELVKTDKFGNKYYNDSKGTNIFSSLIAAEAMDLPTIMIAGGSSKGYEYGELFRKLPKKVISVVAIGETQTELMDAARKEGFKSIIPADGLENAVKTAIDEIRKQNALRLDGIDKNCVALLLSPAAASFDEFKNYEQRGERFCALVKALTD